MPEDFSAFGRQVLIAQGLDPAGYDVGSYGVAARYQMGKGKPVPDAAKFATGPQPPPLNAPVRRSSPPPPPPPPGYAAAPVPVKPAKLAKAKGTVIPEVEGRSVRIGAFEIRMRPLPKNTRHQGHRFQRTTGRARARTDLETERRRRVAQAAAQQRRKDGRFKR